MESSRPRRPFPRPRGPAQAFADPPATYDDDVDVEADTSNTIPNINANIHFDPSSFSQDESPYPAYANSYSAPPSFAFTPPPDTRVYTPPDEPYVLQHSPESSYIPHDNAYLFDPVNRAPYQPFERLDAVNEDVYLRLEEDFVSFPSDGQSYPRPFERPSSREDGPYSFQSDGAFADNEGSSSYGPGDGSRPSSIDANLPSVGSTTSRNSPLPRPFTPNNQDRLTTNIPLKPKVDHIPVLSTRGAGLRLHQLPKAPKPQGVEVELFNGNLVMDVPVPYRLLRQVPHSERDEFSHTRYTAVTCDPSDFSEERYTLRPTLFASPRTTEIMIVLTMYNEDDVLLARTLRGVFANISDISSAQNGRFGGKTSWKKVVVCLVSDGRARINPRTRALLTLLGVYQDGVAKGNVNDKDVTAHLYEYTTQMRVQIKKGIVKVVPSGEAPCQILFCLKEKNQKKINSHRWALQAFGRILDPAICVFIDVGTEPEPRSILHLWNAFDQHLSCGGISGVTKVLMGRQQGMSNNPLLSAQNFEYKMWNILDRPFDSLFGLRFDMPGAMLAYRYIALQNDKYGHGPLNDYFALERVYSEGIFTMNMSLTEERGLSFALITKRNARWDLRYEYAASATIDVPETSSEYVLQRRRWVNGTFFGSIYAITNIHLIFRSGHGARRKLLLFVQCIYQTIALLYSWFSISNLYLMFHVLVATLATQISSSGPGTNLVKFLDFLYAGTLFLSFVFALGHGARDREFLFLLVLAWSGIMILLIIIITTLAIFSLRIISNPSDSSFDPRSINILASIILPLSAIYGTWFVVALVSGSPGFLFTSLIQYILLLPTRINIVNLFAFCNIHDVAWGTKGTDKAPLLSATSLGTAKVVIPDNESADGLDKIYLDAAQLLKTKARDYSSNYFGHEDGFVANQRFRTLVMASWALSNVMLVFVVLDFIGPSADFQINIAFISYVLWWFVSLTGVKCAGALYYFFSQRRQAGTQKVDLMRKKKNK